ncbi:MAG: hypothetical protein HZA36_00995 [Parcubacteria group bacterium]|nr:hypothetical protein [Parcubacteria group bacterium]
MSLLPKKSFLYSHTKLLEVVLLILFFIPLTTPIVFAAPEATQPTPIDKTIDPKQTMVSGGGPGGEPTRTTYYNKAGQDITAYINALKNGTILNTTDGKASGGTNVTGSQTVTASTVSCGWIDAGCVLWKVFSAPAVALINFDLGLLTITASLLDSMIKFNVLHETIRNFWSIIRDFVNLGFVLAMIVIACATMVGIESYGYRKALLNLIIGALLINFSLVFIGFFLDVNNIGSTFILYQISQSPNKGSGEGGTGLDKLIFNMSGATLVTGKPAGLDQQKSTENIVTYSDDSKGIIALADIYVKSVFLLFMAWIFLMLVLVMIVRIGHLINLIIMSPLIWLQNIFDSTRGGWSKWWEEFFMWCFLPTFTLFYFYIAIIIYAMVSNGGAWAAGGGVLDNLLAMLLVGVTVSTLIGVGLKTAFEHSQGASSIAVRLSQGAGHSAAKTFAKTGAGKRIQRMGDEMTQKGLSRKGGLLGWKGALGNMQASVGQGLQQAGTAIRKPLDEKTKQDIANADRDTVQKNVDLYAKLDASSKLTSAEKKAEAVAWMKKHAENGGKFKADQTENAYKLFSAEGDTDSFLKNAGQFDPESLNTLIATGSAKRNVAMQMKLAAGLSKNKKLKTSTLEAMQMGDAGHNKLMQSQHAEEYKAITGSHIAYQEGVLGASSDKKGEAMANAIIRMNSGERSNVDVDSLMEHADGGQAVVLSGDAMVSQVLNNDNAGAHLEKIRGGLERNAGGRDIGEYAKEKHRAFYNGIAKRNYHVNIVAPNSPMASWKPSKKDLTPDMPTSTTTQSAQNTTLSPEEEIEHAQTRQARMNYRAAYTIRPQHTEETIKNESSKQPGVSKAEIVSELGNAIPFVGGGKEILQGVFGKTADGRELSEGERVKSAIGGAANIALDLTGIGEAVDAARAAKVAVKSAEILRSASTAIKMERAAPIAKALAETAKIVETNHGVVQQVGTKVVQEIRNAAKIDMKPPEKTK